MFVQYEEIKRVPYRLIVREQNVDTGVNQSIELMTSFYSVE